MHALSDLFVPVIAEADRHPYFQRILLQATESEKQVLRDWALGFADRDGKFVKEFQSTFNACFWELYLFACLKQLRTTIDLKHPSPDFIADGPLGSLALEAVVALNPEALAPDWAIHGIAPRVAEEELLDLAALRLAQSVENKAAKWLNSYGKLPHCDGRSYVICVAPFEQPHGQLQGTQAISRVLFGERVALVLNDAGRALAVGASTIAETFKPSGAPVRLGLFRDERISHVAGVLFSAMATWTKVSALARDDGTEFWFTSVRRAGNRLCRQTQPKAEFVEGLLDGLHLFLNPFAIAPLDPNPWLDAGVGVHWLDGPALEYRAAVPDGSIVMRSCIRVAGPGASSYATGTPKASEFPAHLRATPGDGEWFGGPGTLGTADSVYLTLHNGWTICLGRCTIDNDWQYIVKWGEFLSLQEFIDAGDPGPKRAGLGVSLPTRDVALAEARALIARLGIRKWRPRSKKRKGRG